jgi:hypothetical protein
MAVTTTTTGGDDRTLDVMFFATVAEEVMVALVGLVGAVAAHKGPVGGVGDNVRSEEALGLELLQAVWADGRAAVFRVIIIVIIVRTRLICVIFIVGVLTVIFTTGGSGSVLELHRSICSVALEILVARGGSRSGRTGEGRHHRHRGSIVKVLLSDRGRIQLITSIGAVAGLEWGVSRVKVGAGLDTAGAETTAARKLAAVGHDTRRSRRRGGRRIHRHEGTVVVVDMRQ